MRNASNRPNKYTGCGRLVGSAELSVDAQFPQRHEKSLNCLRRFVRGLSIITKLCPTFDTWVTKTKRFSCLAIHDDSTFHLFEGALAGGLSARHFTDGRQI